jgi:GNAT superfamily N-acetyltransferase
MTECTRYGGLDIGPYRPDEEDAVLDCMLVCFGREQESERWRHLYGKNPFGRPIRFVARERGLIVSHAAILPRKFTAFGKQGLAGFSTGAMTRPEWRRKGLSRILVAKAQKIAERRGFFMLYSTPNNYNIGNALKYQGRRVVGSVAVMLRPIRPFRTGFLIVQRKLLGGQKTSSFSSIPNSWMRPAFDDRHSKLFREADSIPPISVVRDSTYLSWRYPAKQHSPYLQRDIKIRDSVEATIVISTSLQFGIPLVFVMEWLWKREKCSKALQLMHDAIHFARSVDAYGVAALAMPGTVERGLLRRLGFIWLPQVFLPQTATLTVSPKPPLEASARWFELPNWYLTFGDATTL